MGKRRGDSEIAAVRSRLQAEFVSNISSPDRALEDLPISSPDQCRWRCTEEGCGHEWETRFQFRARSINPTACPECSKRRNRAPGPGESLAEVDKVLTAQFRRNKDRPSRGPDTLRTQSHDMCEWECEQGHSWLATVANRTNQRGCPHCSGHGRSLFECNVAMLVEAASGLAVELDHRVRLPGRTEDRFDLFLPGPDLLIDLDPAWTHNQPDGLKRDTAKAQAARAAGLVFVRIRARGLPAIPLPWTTHFEAGPGLDPEDWARAVGSVLRGRGLPWKELAPPEVATALMKGSQLWQQAVAAPATSALAAAPHLEAEFVANLTNPGVGLARMAPGCNDLCTWKCQEVDCGHEWDVPVYTRALAGRGCRKCGYKRMATKKRRPTPGTSLGDVNREMASELVEVIGHPDWTAFDLLPNANQDCLWKCPDPRCGRCTPHRSTAAQASRVVAPRAPASAARPAGFARSRARRSWTVTR